MALVLPDNGFLISLDKSSEFSKKAKYFYDKANTKKIKQIIKASTRKFKRVKKIWSKI